MSVMMDWIKTLSFCLKTVLYSILLDVQTPNIVLISMVSPFLILLEKLYMSSRKLKVIAEVFLSFFSVQQLRSRQKTIGKTKTLFMILL